VKLTAALRVVERLMGRDPAQRFEFIQSRASAVEDDAIDA
jgi:DNA gyrase/topoisomerase IV subunit B